MRSVNGRLRIVRNAVWVWHPSSTGTYWPRSRIPHPHPHSHSADFSPRKIARLRAGKKHPHPQHVPAHPKFLEYKFARPIDPWTKIAEAVMLTMMRRYGTPALCVHDSSLVERRFGWELRDVMAEAFEKQTGRKPPRIDKDPNLVEQKSLDRRKKAVGEDELPPDVGDLVEIVKEAARQEKAERGFHEAFGAWIAAKKAKQKVA